MAGIEKGNEFQESRDVREITPGREAVFSREALDWFDQLMNEDTGKLREDGSVFGRREARQEANTGGSGIDYAADSEIDRSRESGQVERGEPVTSENAARSVLMPRNGGKWSGEPGNSTWNPDRESEPGDRHGTNPEHKKWGEILDEYGIDGIRFDGGEADFSEVAKGTVEIADFTDDRDINFTQADEKLAEARGCTPEEVAEWRKENAYTWHECKDLSTMQKVPTKVHGNISHSGGIAEYKAKISES